MPIVHVIHLLSLVSEQKHCCAINFIFLSFFFFYNTGSKMLLSGTHKMVFLISAN